VRIAALAAALALLVLWSRPTSALTILPNPVPLDNSNGIVGSIQLLDIVTGLPTGGVVGDGSVGASDTTLVFAAHNVESFPSDFWNIVTVRLETVAGGSAIAPAAIGIVPPETNLSADLIGPTGLAQFGASLGEGETSNAFFVSYPGPLAADGSLQIRVAAGEGVNFAFGTALVIPEPTGTLLIALGGIPLLARRSRRRPAGR
jgi:hypothetical protein